MEKVCSLKPSEMLVAKSFVDKGYKFLHSGCPDFVFFKQIEGKIYDVKFVEVKFGMDKLKNNQKLFHKILESVGIKPDVIFLDSDHVKYYKERYAKCKTSVDGIPSWFKRNNGISSIRKWKYESQRSYYKQTNYKADYSRLVFFSNEQISKPFLVLRNCTMEERE